jgi:uncharacterized membrane protein YfcA
VSQALLAIPFGLAIGLLLGLVGGGGSFVAVPVLVYVLDQDVKVATTTSLLVVGVSALVGGLSHARAGHVRWRAALAFGAAAIVGALAGTAFNRAADPDLIIALFALVLAVAAYFMARGRGLHPHGTPESRAGLVLRVAPAGLGLGVLTGFFGVGGGFVILPALVLLLALPLDAAVGTSLVVIANTSAVALLAHLASGPVDWALASTLTLSAVVGALAGTRLGERVSDERLRQGFAVLLALLACFLAGASAVALLGD